MKILYRPGLSDFFYFTALPSCDVQILCKDSENFGMKHLHFKTRTNNCGVSFETKTLVCLCGMVQFGFAEVYRSLACGGFEHGVER